MVSDAIWIAIIGVIGIGLTVGVPLIGRIIDNRNMARVLAAANARADIIATKAEEVAKALHATNAATNAKLDGITSMVDGSLTISMVDQMDARIAHLMTLQELVEIRKLSGKPVDQETEETIAALRVKIAELKAIVAERTTREMSIRLKK
jgi:hypothetical protein